MKVLHLLSSPVFSGPADSVALLASAQRRAGATVTVAVDRTREGTGTEEPALPRFQALGLLDERGLALSTRGPPWEVVSDARLLRRSDLDVLHCHASHDHWVARLGRAGRARVVRSLHAPRSIRWSLPAAAAFTVPDESLLSPLPRGPVMVLPALLDRAAFRPPEDRAGLRAALGVPSGPLIGMTSTFQASRRHDVALAAFGALRRRAPGATLLLIGDGVLEPELRAAVFSAGLEGAVQFPGYQRGPQFVRWLQALDELWVLGLGNDWAGRVALQARACGVRVVAARLGALPRWADVVLDAVSPEALVAAALTAERRTVPVPDLDVVAREVLALYRQAGAGT